MISAWWLLLIVPAAYIAGFALCGIMIMGSKSDECSECYYYRQMQKEKETK